MAEQLLSDTGINKPDLWNLSKYGTGGLRLGCIESAARSDGRIKVEALTDERQRPL